MSKVIRFIYSLLLPYSLFAHASGDAKIPSPKNSTAARASARVSLTREEILNSESATQLKQKELEAAIFADDHGKIRDLLRSGANLDQKVYRRKDDCGVTFEHLTAVHLAIFHGNYDSLEVLLKENMAIQCEAQVKLFYEAKRKKKEALAKAAAEKALELASQEIPEVATEEKQEVDEVSNVPEEEFVFVPCYDFLLLKDHPRGLNPFHLTLEEYFKAVKKGDKSRKAQLEKTIHYLLSFIQDRFLIAENNKGQNPFHIIAREGDIELLSVFLSYSKDEEVINKIDRQGITPLESAARNRHLVFAEQLLSYVPDLELQGDPEDLFIKAVQLLRCDLIIFFCEKYKGNPDILQKRDKHGNTPLHLLVSRLSTKIQRKSVMTPAEISRRKSQQCPVKARNQGARALKALIEALVVLAPEALNAQDADLETALHMAVKGSALPAVRYLIENGANASIKGSNGLTPWNYLKKVRGDQGLTAEEFEIRQIIKDATFSKFIQWVRSLKKPKYRPEIKRFISDDHEQSWAQSLNQNSST